MRLPNKFNGYQADGGRQYHKGGDGGAKAARKQEEERQRRVKLAIDAVNGIFDSKPYTVGTGAATSFDPNATYYDSKGNAWKPPVKPDTRRRVRTNRGDSYESRYKWEVVRGGYDMDAINKAIKNGELFTGMQTITPEKTRQQLYDEQKQAVYDINSQDVDRQYKDAERTNRFGLARSGLLGGSADVDSNAELQRKTNEGLIRAAGLGDQAAADLKASDENARKSLLGMAQSGMEVGQAQSAALRDLDASTQRAAGQRTGAILGGLFNDMTKAYMRQYPGTGTVVNAGQQWGGDLSTSGSYGGSVIGR